MADWCQGAGQSQRSERPRTGVRAVHIGDSAGLHGYTDDRQDHHVLQVRSSVLCAGRSAAAATAAVKRAADTYSLVIASHGSSVLPRQGVADTRTLLAQDKGLAKANNTAC